MIPPDKLDHEALEVDDRDKLRDGRVCIVNATVTAVTWCENTVDLLLEDDSEVNGVPVFYHCQGVKTAKGGIMAFEEEDLVLLYREYDGDGGLVDQYVIGFQDKPHYCNKYLLVILVGSSSYGYSNVKVIVWDVLASDFGAIEVNDKIINQWPIPYDDEDFQDWLDLPAVTYLGAGWTRGGSNPSSFGSGQYQKIVTIAPDVTTETHPYCQASMSETYDISGDTCACVNDPWCYCTPVGGTCLQEWSEDNSYTPYIKRSWIDPYTLERFEEWVYFMDGGGNCVNHRDRNIYKYDLHECKFSYPANGLKVVERLHESSYDMLLQNCLNPYAHGLGGNPGVDGKTTGKSYWSLGVPNYFIAVSPCVCTVGCQLTGGMTETYLGELNDIQLYSRVQDEDAEFTHVSHVEWNSAETNIDAYLVPREEQTVEGSISLHTTITHKRWGKIYDYTSSGSGTAGYRPDMGTYRFMNSSAEMHTGSYYSATLTFNQIGCDISFWLAGVGYTEINYNCALTQNYNYAWPYTVNSNTSVHRAGHVVDAWAAIEDTRNGGEGYSDAPSLAALIAMTGKEVWDATVGLETDLTQGVTWENGQPAPESFTLNVNHDNVNFVPTLRLYKEFSH